MRAQKAVTPDQFEPDQFEAPEPGLQFDHLPESIRRLQRFGSAAAARHAEAVALRREIDAVAGRLAAWVAATQGGQWVNGQVSTNGVSNDEVSTNGVSNEAAEDAQDGRDAVLQITWVHLRRAGLALRAEIDRHEISRQESDQRQTSRLRINDRFGVDDVAAETGSGA